MHNINILGSGLYGVCLAKLINKKINDKKLNCMINLYEKSDSILAAWKPKEIEKYFINNGFHAIEMPRAKETIKILNDLGCQDSLEEISNLRLISINKELISYDSNLDQWPNKFKREFEYLLKELKLEQVNNQKYFDKVIKFIRKTYIGQLLEKCSLRYTDKFYDAWYLFYPWFFPPEFMTSLDDEGDLFQITVRKKKLIPTYIVPKNFVFESLINKIENSLKKENINLNKNHQVDKKFLENLTNNNQLEQTYIWSASSFELLRILDSNKAKSLLSNKRYIHLLLFSPINFDSFLNWHKKYNRHISEILCIDENLPNLARISFPKCKNNNQLKIYKQTIMVEYYSQEEGISDEEIFMSKEYLNELFNFKINYIGNCFGRTIYNLTEINQLKGEIYLKKLLSNTKLRVPNIYWGPINMSKCGIMAHDYSKKIFD